MGQRLGRRDAWTTGLLGGGFLLLALPLALQARAELPSPAVVALLVGVYAVVMLFTFEVGPGAVAATELVLVPMLFLLPPAAVPLCVAGGILLGTWLENVAGRLRLERVALALLSSWHAVGPAAVLIVAGGGEPSWDDWPWYVLALGAQFAVDGICATAWARFALGIPPREQLRYMPHAWSVDLALAPVGFVVALAATTHAAAVLAVLPLVALLAYFARERRQRIDHALELGHAYRGTALLLGDVVEADDAYTGSHSRDVVELVLAVADELGLDARERRRAEFAALLHDVGKIRIPNEIIRKPGRLTDEERALMETHTVIGQELLEKVGGLLGDVGRIVRSCHERWDGAGYPDGLGGAEIPLVARIVCCCDAFSAITTDRPYRAARSEEEAVAELRRSAGTHFDPQVVDALCRIVETWPQAPAVLSPQAA
jgi:putative nucleotidyltransferase with HDIG domain